MSFNNNNNLGTGGGGRFNRRDRKSKKAGYKFNHNNNNNRQKYTGDYDNSRGNDQRVTFNNNNNNNNNNGRWRDRVGLAKRPASIACAEWFKVVIPKARQFTRESLIEQISSIFGPPPMMYNFHWEQDNIVFWVASADQQTFRAFNRRLYDSNRGQLRVNVSPDNIPLPPDDVETRAKILQAMRGRYSVNDRYLNLSNFTHDPLLMGANLHIPLNKPFTLSMVLRLMVQNFPDVICLNFSHNNLESLKPFSQPNIKLDIKALDISHNKIKKSHELSNLQLPDLLELIIVGNPFANVFNETERTTLMTFIRSKFPKVVKLDSAELPPAIGFDIGGGEIPSVYGHCIPNEIKSFVGEFLGQYYKIYDSDDRSQLLAAYHDNAVFSFSLANNQKQNKFAPFNGLMKSGDRNLRNQNPPVDTAETLHRGGRAVVETLKKLPSSYHLSETIIIDVPLCLAEFFIICVNGLYRETNKKHVNVRSFARTFVVVPHGSGYVIINDTLIISTSPQEKANRYRNFVNSKTITEVITGETFNANSFASLSLDKGMDGGFGLNVIPNQPNLIEQFCIMTKMNHKFSKQCLEENGLDLEKAFQVFSTLNASGAIPPEAFVLSG
ncbi:nuclear RNA export factor 1-like isoform X2 [Brevipalpus obovatus]|uniref:nuclear RNA export factor 1-like isoform X2 n=1 Tax=Brevipalpus obovatus TaxID=246614 RepID=UPI003D9E198B